MNTEKQIARKLNSDIKKLYNFIESLRNTADNDTFFKSIETYAKNEFLRLYDIDRTFTLHSKESVLIMMRLNISHRFIAFHQFGLNIEIQ